MTKTETVAIRLTPEEKEKIKEQAAKEDVTISKYLHKLIFPVKDKEMEVA